MEAISQEEGSPLWVEEASSRRSRKSHSGGRCPALFLGEPSTIRSNSLNVISCKHKTLVTSLLYPSSLSNHVRISKGWLYTSSLWIPRNTLTRPGNSRYSARIWESHKHKMVQVPEAHDLCLQMSLNFPGQIGSACDLYHHSHLGIMGDQIYIHT